MDWGRRYLMCPPDHYRVEYAINPWMAEGTEVDRELAHDQWLAVRDAIEQAGGSVAIIEQPPHLPDMVFTANLGLVADGIFVPARMQHPERAEEPGLAANWAMAAGFQVTPMPAGMASFEGMGDGLPFGGWLIAGDGPRSTPASWAKLSALLGWQITPLELVDPRFYHVDLVFCPLSDRAALVAPIGLTAAGLETVAQIVPDPILLNDAESLAFMANSITVGETVIMPACSKRIRGRLAEIGLDVVVVDVGEFLKAGGAVRCLTLPLDAQLSTVLEQSA